MRSDDLTTREVLLLAIVILVCIGMCLGIFLLAPNGGIR
jgi:hypothetical protein